MTLEVVTGKDATIHFDAQKCIHPRITAHCQELPVWPYCDGSHKAAGFVAA